MGYFSRRARDLVIWMGKTFGFRIISVENIYVGYIPDRYSLNFDKYKESTSFLQYSDLTRWNKGNYANNAGDISRFFFLNLCFDQLLEEKLKGSVAEVGVYKGNSAVLLAKYARRANCKCYLFDTYAGFNASDKVGIDSGVESTYSDTSLDEVRKLVGEQNTHYIKGYIQDSLRMVDEDEVYSLVHIDCDLALPTIAALEYFYPRTTPGGFIIIHDYSSMFWAGCTSAVNQFFSDKPESVVPIPDKSGSCVVRKIKSHGV